ncbi:MAG: BCCT family transporter, partial [Pseudomonadales bacterium]|nr:BCCT family transporter [Pseudomonadales bacterium]
TSLGFGVTQINAGLGYLFGVPESPMVQVLLIGGITMLATASVVAGLDSGIKRLSEMNMLLAVTLLLFMFVVGPTAFLMGAYLQNIGAYLADLVDLTFRQFAYQQTDWLGAWTLFYWAWWIAWAPFVGMFIARIAGSDDSRVRVRRDGCAYAVHLLLDDGVR